MFCCVIIALVLLIVLILSVVLAPFIALFGLAATAVSVAVAKIGGGDGNSEDKILSREEALKLEYPYRKLFTGKKDLDFAFEKIKEFRLKVVHTDYTILNMPELSDEQLEFSGEKKLIECSPADYYTMNWVSDWFNEKCRLSCKRYDEKLCPLDYWKENKEKIIDDVLKNRKQLTAKNLSDAVYNKVQGCNNFRPGLMCGFIKQFGAKSVLDFSAGWGDRLIGSIAAGVRYVGVDPNPCVHEGYRQIISELAVGVMGTDPAKYTTIQAPFQTAELPNETFDLVFTSPPYFNLEQYSDAPGQSIDDFSDLESWFNGFLIKSLAKCWEHLNESGHMVVIINNIRGKTDFVMRMVSTVNEFIDSTYLGVMSYADKLRDGNYKSPQPMWIWRKGAERVGAAADDIELAPLEESYVDELAVVAAEKDVMKEVAAGTPWTRARIQELLKYSIDDSSLPILQRKYFHWVILLGGKVIGYIGLYPLDKKSLQFRIFITASEHGKGYGKAALTKMLRTYAEMLGTNLPGVVVYSQMRLDNIPSVKISSQVGFTEMNGTFRVGNTPVRRFILDLEKWYREN